MKNNIAFIKLLFAFTIYLLISNPLMGQETKEVKRDVTVSTGFGVPELSYIGVRFHWKQIQIAYSIGTNFISENPMFSYSNDIYIHYAGYSELSSRRPYYLRLGINYFWEDTDTNLNGSVFFNTRLGREINLTERFGIDVSGGIAYQWSRERLFKEPADNWIDRNFNPPMIPAFGVGIFYKM